MIDARTVFEIHRLAHLGQSKRKIAKTLHLGRTTVARYLKTPNAPRPRYVRCGQLDAFKQMIAQMLDQQADVSGQVIKQRLQEQGYRGGKTILYNYLKTVRQQYLPRAFIRFESAAGEQMQIDWGHFGAITYGSTSRKLYGLGVLESHGRMLYVHFSHSQDQDSLHQGLLNAFVFFNGTPKKIICDNMLTAVIERDGPLIRYNEAFLNFLRPFAIVPQACHVRAAWEKGKVEKGAIHYLRHNFMPLRTFVSLSDAMAQAVEWRDNVANQRIHRSTGQKPIERFNPEALRPLPPVLPDCRQATTVKVHKDFCIHFDANTYSVPPYLIGKRVTLRADAHQLWLYLKDKQVAQHIRCWQRGQRIELAQHRQAVIDAHKKYWAHAEVAILMSLGEDMKHYVEKLIDTGCGIKKSAIKLLALRQRFGEAALIDAVRHAMAHNAFGCEYIENILARTPVKNHAPVKLNKEELNRIYLSPPALCEYDALAIERKYRDE